MKGCELDVYVKAATPTNKDALELMKLGLNTGGSLFQPPLFCSPALPIAVNLQLGCNNVLNVLFNCLLQKHLGLVNLTAECFVLSARCNSLFLSLKRSRK